MTAGPYVTERKHHILPKIDNIVFNPLDKNTVYTNGTNINI